MRNIKPPLPFCGHKGHWGAELTQIAAALPVNCFVFDAFGGSGVCAHYIQKVRPDLCVIWNDFDNYQARLAHVDETELARQHFLSYLGLPVPKNTFNPPLTDEQRAFVFDTVRQWLKKYEFVDMQTLSRWFYLYSHKTYKLMSSTGKLYNRVPVVPMRSDACASWLQGCQRTSVTFTGLDTVFQVFGVSVRPRDYINAQDALFVFDPPYLGTGCNDYDNQESLRVLQSIIDCVEHLPFILFGDASIAFWYEALFKNRRVLKYEKNINNVGMNHKKRSEVMFVSLPGEG
jgi:hypothetical protein